MHMANVENILTWEKASGYPKNSIRGNTGLTAHWCENRIESFRRLKKHPDRMI